MRSACPELYYGGAFLWRRAVAEILGGWVAADGMGEADALRYLAWIGRRQREAGLRDRLGWRGGALETPAVTGTKSFAGCILAPPGGLESTAPGRDDPLWCPPAVG